MNYKSVTVTIEVEMADKTSLDYFMDELYDLAKRNISNFTISEERLEGT